MPYGEHVRVGRLVWERRDLAFAVALAVALEIEIAVAPYAERRPLLMIAGLLSTLPLALRRRAPLLAFALVWCGLALGLKVASPDFDEQSIFFTIVVVFSLYSLGAHARGRQAWAGAAPMPLIVAQFVLDDGDSFHPATSRSARSSSAARGSQVS